MTAARHGRHACQVSPNHEGHSNERGSHDDQEIHPVATLSEKRVRKLFELQVREYIALYRPDLGEVSVEIGPGNTVAKVRSKSGKKPQ